MQKESSTKREATQATQATRQEWPRAESTLLVAAFERARERGVSQRQFAEAEAVPRTTLQHWLKRKANLDTDPELVAFFESPTGLAFLHRLVTALHFLFNQVGLCGVDLICEFLRLTGLEAFVAASHGSQHGLSQSMSEKIVSFGEAERKRMGEAMQPRRIGICEDETFHPEVCLVVIEPVSGMILLETYAENREAATWTEAVREALGDLKVEVVTAASDEGSSLICHINKDMAIHQSPDLFHVQRDLFKALGLALAKSLESPAADLHEAKETTRIWRYHQAEDRARREAGQAGPGRPPAFEKYIAEAEVVETKARAAYEKSVERREGVHEAVRSLSRAYHPVDPETGELRDEDRVEADLDRAFETIDQAAEAIDLGEKGRKRIEKARKVLPKMVATIALFHYLICQSLSDLELNDSVIEYIRSVLVPAAYLAQLASRATTVADRNALSALRSSLLEAVVDDPLDGLSEDLRLQIDRLVTDCITLFIRTTSCVEGRNGRLALWHHHLHRLSEQRLAALTTIHNFWIRRPDGTTAAQRFFRLDHADLFDYLLDHMEVPARPRSHRLAKAA